MIIAWYEVNYLNGEVRRFNTNEIHMIAEGLKTWATENGGVITKEIVDAVCIITLSFNN